MRKPTPPIPPPLPPPQRPGRVGGCIQRSINVVLRTSSCAVRPRRPSAAIVASRAARPLSAEERKKGGNKRAGVKKGERPARMRLESPSHICACAASSSHLSVCVGPPLLRMRLSSPSLLRAGALCPLLRMRTAHPTPPTLRACAVRLFRIRPLHMRLVSLPLPQWGHPTLGEGEGEGGRGEGRARCCPLPMLLFPGS